MVSPGTVWVQPPNKREIETAKRMLRFGIARISATILAQMPYLQAGKIQTYYQKIGTGPTLVLLHGWGQRWDCWAPLIPTLSESFTLVLPDLPGFGQSSTPGEQGWRTADYSAWLDSFLHTLELHPMGFIGHSYGGKVLMEYTSRRKMPHVKLTLIAPSGIKLQESPKKQLLRRLTQSIPEALKQRLPASLKQAFYAKVVQETDYLLADDFQKATLKKILPEDYTDTAKKLPAGCLLIGGTLDTAVPPEAMRILHTSAPESQLHLLETGHFPFQDQPKQCISLLKEYLHA